MINDDDVGFMVLFCYSSAVGCNEFNWMLIVLAGMLMADRSFFFSFVNLVLADLSRSRE